MARRKPYEKIDINVEPFLSIMAIVLKLISLILVVIVMRIAVNPKGKRIIAFAGLYSGHNNVTNPKIPSYIDCQPDKLVVRPRSVKLYRTVRKLIGKRPIEVGYDAIDADFKVDWNEAEKGLAISAD